jgi:hypothetical protein
MGLRRTTGRSAEGEHAEWSQPGCFGHKFPIEGREFQGARAARQVQGIGKIHTRRKPVEGRCNLDLVFDLNRCYTRHGAKKICYPLSLEGVCIPQNPLCFEKNGLCDPDSVVSDEIVGSLGLTPVVAHEITNDDVSIDREHGDL